MFRKFILLVPALVLASTPAFAACPIPVWVNDYGKHSDTEEGAGKVFEGNIDLFAIFEINQENARLLGAVDLKKTSPIDLPESQKESIIPPAIRQNLPPETLRGTESNNVPRTDYTSPGGSVRDKQLDNLRGKARSGVNNEINRHRQGLNDYQYWERAGPDPRDLIRERARNNPDIARIRDATQVPDISERLYKDVSEAELHQVLNSRPTCRMPQRSDLFGPRGIVTKIAGDPRNAPEALVRDIQSGRLLLDSLTPHQESVLNRILQNPTMSAAALAPLLADLPVDVQGPIRDALAGAKHVTEELAGDLSLELLNELERHSIALTPELERFKQDMARWNLPRVRLPEIDLPDIDLPDIDLPDIPELGNIPDDMRDALRAIGDETGQLIDTLKPNVKKYAHYLQNPDLLKDMGEREFRRFLDTLPPQMQRTMQFVKDPKGFARQFANGLVPPEVLHYIKVAGQIRDRVEQTKEWLENFHPRMLLTKEMKTLIQLIENPTHIVNFLPAEYRQLAKAILRLKSLKDLFRRIVAHPSFPRFIRQAMQDPKQFARDKMIDYANKYTQEQLAEWNQGQRHAGPVCSVYTADTRIDDNLGARAAQAPRDQSEFDPSPVKAQNKKHKPPARASQMEAETRARIPAALPVHGAPLVGGHTTPQAMAAYQYSSTEMALTAAGLNGPDYDSHVFKPASILASYSCPEDGWGQDKTQEESAVTEDGLPPSTGGIASPTDVFWAGTGLYKEKDGSWIAKHLPEARETYVMAQAIDAWALQVAAANNVVPKSNERELIFESMQKCTELQCEIRHVILLQTHLLELEMETARLQIALLNLETANALNAEDVYLP